MLLSRQGKNIEKVVNNGEEGREGGFRREAWGDDING